MVFLLTRKHHISVINIGQKTMFRKVITVYTKTNANPVSTVSEQNTKLLNVKAYGTLIYHHTIVS